MKRLIVILLGIVAAGCVPCSLTATVQSAPSGKAGLGSSIHKENAHVLVGAGDIAGCSNLSGARATAKLLASTPGTVFADGDLVYPNGNLAEFKTCYGPTWGRFKRRTHPALGNHEYQTKNAAGYFDYFGGAAGPKGEGYYSYDLGPWHIIVLNTNCSDVTGGCGVGSPQEEWLRKDLLSHNRPCKLAYFHQPLFSSSEVGNDEEVKPFWQDLYHAGVEIVVNGHAHDYERFAPQNPEGIVDQSHGIREIIVGTGGKDHAHFVHIDPNSVVRNNDTFGVLKLTLYPGRYSWRFIPVAGSSFTDSGSGTCHE
ncbi:MAG: metallophosphoesterase family protein [Acidobacteriaceae bacterium]